jgi:formate--tetrahydrofolate ligase
MKDWQISEAAEANMPTPEEWREKLGLQKDEMLAYGRIAKLDFLKIIERLKSKPDGKYIEVTAITPTPLGEGKSTTSCGLMEGMGKRGLNVGGALRQPSGGPTMNIKGTAAGGGNALLIPMTEFTYDRVFHGAYRRYQRHHERPQPGHGSIDLTYAARAQLRR